MPTKPDGTPSVPDPASPPLLSYVRDLPGRYGISYEVRGPVAYIAVPPTRRFLYWLMTTVGPAFVAMYIFLQGALTLIQLIANNVPGGTGEYWFALAWGLAISVGALFCAIAILRDNQKRRRQVVIFELTPQRLFVRDADRRAQPRTRSWPRNDILGFLTGPVPWNAPTYAGLGIHIRVSKMPPVEVMPGHPPEVAKWVADRLNDALRAPT